MDGSVLPEPQEEKYIKKYICSLMLFFERILELFMYFSVMF